MRPDRPPVALLLVILISALLMPARASAQNFCDFAPRIDAPQTRGAVGVQVILEVSVVDPNGDAISSLTADTSALPAGNDAVFTASADNTSGTLTWTPQAGQTGTFHVPITATNALSTTVSATLSIIDTASAPFVECPAFITVSEFQPISFHVTAGDPDGEPIVSLTSPLLPSGATFTVNATNTSGTWAWTPNFTQAGTYNIQFVATSSTSATYTTAITVTNGDRAPVVIAPPSASGAEGTLLTVCVQAADPDGDAITSLTASPLPPGATFTSSASHLVGTFSWTPATGQAGTYNVVFSATNALTGQASVQITIGPAGDAPPLVSAPAAKSTNIDNTLFFTVSASDPNGDPITSFAAAPLPSGAAFFTSADNTQGSFQWTPMAGQEGTYFVAFTATSNGVSATATTAISVGTIRTALVFTTGGNKTLRLNSGKATWCLDITPIGVAWDLADILTNTLVLQSSGTGTVSEIAAPASKSPTIGDVNKDLVPDMEICFLKTDLRQLFSNLTGRQTVPVTVRGNLASGGIFTGAYNLDVAAGGGNAAASLTPNPPNPAAMLRFTTSQPGAIQARVFDIRGRLVRTLETGAEQYAGDHALRFDGLGDSGKSLPTGIYLFRVETADGELTTKAAILR